MIPTLDIKYTVYYVNYYNADRKFQFSMTSIFINMSWMEITTDAISGRIGVP